MDSRYIVVAGAVLVQFTVIGLFIGYAVLFKSFEEEFGWSRALLSSMTSAAILIMGILAVAGGRLVDRYGPRIVLGVTGVVFGAGFAMISQVDQAWQLILIFGFSVGLGMSTHDVVTLSTVVRFFERRRGIMAGIVKFGAAAGQFVVPPLLALMVASLGWRDAVMVAGLGAIVLLLVAAAAMRRPPEPSVDAASRSPTITFAEARRSWIFWKICAIQFLFFTTLTTIPVHIVVYGTDLGLSLGEAAWLISIFGGVSAAGRLLVGSTVDRIGGRRAYFVCFVPLILFLVALLFIRDPLVLFPMMAVYGFAHGGLFTVISPTLAEYFGTGALGSIFGVVLFFGSIGGAAGPIVAGRIFDLWGSYLPAFAILLGMVMMGMFLAWTLPRAVSSR